MFSIDQLNQGFQTLVVIFILLTPLNKSFAQSGSLDLTFHPNDLVFDNGNFEVIASVPLSDGKFIIGGTFIAYNGTSTNRIARVNADGSFDSTFNSGSGADGSVQSIAIQEDNKIIIAGNFTSYNGTAINRMARLNVNGSLDETFNIGSGANNLIRSILVQPDGKILISGGFTTFNGTTRNRIARLNTNGSLDGTFAPSSGANSAISAMVLQTDGKIIIGGSFSTFNSTSRVRIARVNTNGSLDQTFNTGNGPNNTVESITILSDGKLLIGGTFTAYNSTNRNRIVRLSSTGVLDNSFVIGTGTNSTVQSIKIQSDGKIIISGNFVTYNGSTRNRIARLNADGTLDATFNPENGAPSVIYTSFIQPDGKILIGGSFKSFNGRTRNRLARLNANGTLDATFNPGTGADNTIWTNTILPNGKINIGGVFNDFDEVDRNHLALLNANGTLDENFQPGTGTNGDIYTSVLQTDGKMIIGGDFTSYNGNPRNYIARINADGSIDETFDPETGANNVVLSACLQTDGKIIIGGFFTSYAGTPRNFIARLNADGSLDATFNPGTGANSDVWKCAIQPDGKIVVVGSFTTFNGTTKNRIVRLNPDGTFDANFNTGAGTNNHIWTCVISPDGKIVIGGAFTTYNGISRKSIARLNSDGLLDTSFNPGTGANGAVWACAVLPDEKILIGGAFTFYHGTATNYVTRLNSNGIIDASFNPGTGANNEVRTITLQPSGNIIITGIFTSFDGKIRNRIARLIGDNTCPSSASSLNATIAQGQSYLFDNQNLTVAGTYSATFQNVAGCDSVVTLNLSIVPALQYELTASSNQICAGEEAELTVNLLGATYPAGYVHCNPNNPTQVVDVTNPTTGKTWMDRNLGANRAAISSTDAEAYGSMFQWGRFADGHQCVNRFSGDGVTTSGTTPTLSTTATPSHGNFIAVNNAQWQSPTVNNLWQGVDGINNPCPNGYRLPTESELEAERLSWQQAPINSTNNSAGGFASPLKFTVGGRRNNSNGSVTNVGSYGAYWSSTALAFEEISMDLIIGVSFEASVEWNHNRSNGISVRCIKN